MKVEITSAMILLAVVVCFQSLLREGLFLSVCTIRSGLICVLF